MDGTPSSGMTLEELTERSRRMVLRYAEVSPYWLNPKQEVWEGIARALARQALTFGWPFCP